MDYSSFSSATDKQTYNSAWHMHYLEYWSSPQRRDTVLHSIEHIQHFTYQLMVASYKYKINNQCLGEPKGCHFHIDTLFLKSFAKAALHKQFTICDYGVQELLTFDEIAEQVGQVSKYTINQVDEQVPDAFKTRGEFKVLIFFCISTALNNLKLLSCTSIPDVYLTLNFCEHTCTFTAGTEFDSFTGLIMLLKKDLNGAKFSSAVDDSRKDIGLPKRKFLPIW